MKMHIYFISILLYAITEVSGSDSKYIDLLPDKEKQDFLDKIARRILEEVQTKDDRLRESSEIPDDQLNEQDAFVKKIMEEETKNLRRDFNDTEHGTNDIDNIARLLPQEEEKKKETYVDLTLRTEKNRTKRESKRRVFTGFSPDNDNSTEHNDKESDVDIQVKNFRRRTDSADDMTIFENTETTMSTTINDNKIEENSTKTQDEKEDRESASQYNHQQQTEVTTQDNIKENKTEVTTPNNTKEQKTEVTTQDNIKDAQYNHNVLRTNNDESNDYSKTSENNSQSQNIESTTQDTYHNMPTEDTASEPVQLEEIKKTYENINYFISEKIKENKLIMTNTTRIESTKTTKDIENVSKPSTLTVLSHVELNKTKKKQLKDSDVINIDIEPIRSVKDKRSTSHNNNNHLNHNDEERITTTTEIIVGITPATPHKTFRIKNKANKALRKISKPKKLKKNKRKAKNKGNSGKKTKLQMTKASVKFVNDIIDALRLKLLQKNAKNVNDRSSKSTKKAKKQLRVHNVFEIHPNEPPFVLKQPKKQPKPQKPDTKQLTSVQPNRKLKDIRPVQVSEQPFHVPIYNYLPNNAFYNPSNVYGPNFNNKEDTDNNKKEEEEYVITKTDEGYKFPKFPSFMPISAKNLQQNQKPLTNEEPFLTSVYYYSPKNAFYNPNNYYGPNLHDGKKKQVINIDVNDNVSYGTENYDKPYKERDQIEWQYFNDKTRVKNEEPRNMEKYQSDPFEVDLPKSVVDFLLNHKEIDLQGYIDDNYNKRSKLLRCCKYKNRCKKCNYDPKSEEVRKSYHDDEEVTDMPMINTMSKMRHMMLQAKHFMYDKPTDTSKYEIYLDNDKNENETNIQQRYFVRSSRKHPTKYEDIIKRENLKRPIKYEDLVNVEKQHPTKYEDLIQREKLKQKQNNNIALNYYDDTDSKERRTKKMKDEDVSNEIENNPSIVPKYKLDPIQLIYLNQPEKSQRVQDFKYKIKDYLQKPAKYKKPREPYKLFLNLILSKYFQAKKKQHIVLRHTSDYKKLELEMVKQLAKDLEDDEILELYFLIQKIEEEEREKKSGRSRGVEDEMAAYVEVLGDMVRENSKALKSYDWLGTAVELRSAMKKMVDMVETVQSDEDIHPSDLELLKYIVFLHSYAQDELEETFSESGLRGFAIAPGRRPKHRIRPPVLAPRPWEMARSTFSYDQLEEFQTFLEDLQQALHDLHIALKYIAMVTKYKNQQWFSNLKQIHLDNKKKQLLELILHLCSSKLFEMIEESAKNGLEDDFIAYIEKNEKEVYRTKEEFLFVLKLLEEIKSIH